MNNLIKKIGLGTAAIATLSTVAISPAMAQRYGHRGYERHHRGGDAGTAIAAGIVGLAIGAAIASGDRHDRRYDYDRRYYRDHGYYPTDGYYARDYSRRYNHYRYCSVRRVWDPYLHRRVAVRYCR